MTKTISLSQAHKLVNRIDQRINEIQLCGTATIEQFRVDDDIEQYVTSMRQSMEAQIERRSTLLAIKYAIRRTIQQSNTFPDNEEKSINDRIVTIHHLQMQVKLLSSVVFGIHDGVLTSVRDIKQWKEHAMQGSASYVSPSTEIALVDVDDINNQIQQLRQSIQENEDKLSVANNTLTITLNDYSLSVLEKEHIVC